MDQQQKLDYLIRELCSEMKQYGDPADETANKKRLFRSLMNVRMPGAVSEDFLRIQDEYLKKEAEQKGMIAAEKLPSVKEEFGSKIRHGDRICLWKGDITRLSADAIVNAANSRMLGCFVPCHGCIDNAIHSAAGIMLREECFRIMKEQGHEEPVGQAKITPGFNLPCRFVLHTVGPIVRGILTAEDCHALESCYLSCLELAKEKELDSIVFCCISTGEYHFPNRRAAEIALHTVLLYLDKENSIKRVVFNVFKKTDWEIYRKLF